MNKKRKNYWQPYQGTDEGELFLELCSAFEKLGVAVRLEQGDFRSGLCRVGSENWIFLMNRKRTLPEQLPAMVEALASLDHERLYLSPRLRLLLEGVQRSTSGSSLTTAAQ